MQKDFEVFPRNREAYLAKEFFAGRKVLVVDYNSDRAIATLTKFRTLGMEVCWGRDQGEAAHALAREKFDLLLVDGDGTPKEVEELCSGLKELAAKAKIPLIVHSGRNFLQLQDLMKRSGMRGVLPKHASVDVVKELLLGWINPKG